jgi:hypothetical protein
MGAHHAGLEENDGGSSSPTSTSFLIHMNKIIMWVDFLKGWIQRIYLESWDSTHGGVKGVRWYMVNKKNSLYTW